MASIQTAIELHDNFTGVLYHVIDSVSLAINYMDEMRQSLCADIDTASLEGAREEINQATMAVAKLNSAVENMGNPSIQMPNAVPEQEVPVKWQSKNIPMFSGTGIERYQQQVQSVNSMLKQLSSTQDDIARKAYNTMLFPPEAFQDMNSMAVRIDTVKAKIQEMECNALDLGVDAANADFARLLSFLNQADKEQNKLNDAMRNMDVGAANASYNRLNQIISSTEQYIQNNTDAQEQFNHEVNDTVPLIGRSTQGFKGWQAAIITANQALNLIQNTLGRLGVFNMDGVFDRIDTINRFQRTVTIMTGDSELASAAMAKLKEVMLGTAYGLDAASKATQGFLTRGMSIGAATDQVRIWADAVSFYGSGTNEQLESVVDAIGKMYSKGTVEADQLDRLFDAGIGAAEIYAQAVGRNVGEVKDDLSKGTISAADFLNVVSKSMDAGISNGAAKEAGDNWTNTFSNMGAAINRGWVEVITGLDEALASHGLPTAMEMVNMFGQKVELILTGIGNAMGFVIEVAMNIYNTMCTVADFISSHWSVIGPIVYGVVAALIVYYAWQLICAAGSAIMSAAMMLLSANPVILVVLAIIALIIVIFIVCNKIAEMSGMATSGFGIMTGGVNVVIQFFKNLGLSVANVALGIWEALGACAENVQVAFHNSICNVQSWWYDMLSSALTVVEEICRALNKLPFVEFDYSGISSAAEDYARKSAAADNKEDYVSISDAFDKGINTFDAFENGWVKDAFDSGAEWGDGIAEKISNFDIKDFFGDFLSKIPKDLQGDDKNKNIQGNNNNTYPPEMYDTTLYDNNMPKDVGDISKNTKGIKNSMDITKEDLKYLRDIAEMEYVNKFTTAEIKVEMGGITNQINSNLDIDGVSDEVSNKLFEEITQTMYAVAEGAH